MRTKDTIWLSLVIAGLLAAVQPVDAKQKEKEKQAPKQEQAKNQPKAQKKKGPKKEACQKLSGCARAGRDGASFRTSRPRECRFHHERTP